MLPRKYRLHLRTERNRVMATGKTLHSQFFTVIISSAAPLQGEAPATAGEGVMGEVSSSLFSVITSVKFHPLSVKRHQAKRLVHQIIQENLTTIPTGRDIIIIPKKTVFDSDKSTIATDLLNLLSSK